MGAPEHSSTYCTPFPWVRRCTASTGSFAADIDDRVGAELFPHLEASVAGAGQDDGLGAQCLGYADAHEPYRPWTNDDDSLAGDDAAHDIQPVHRRPGGDDERRFRVAHLVRDMSEGIDVVDSVFGKAAIGAEAVGPVPLRAIAVIQARGVHALAAAQTAATPGMHLDRDAVADLKLVDGRAELDDRAHIFVARREAAIEWQLAINHRRHAVADDLDVRRADRDRIDPHQHLGRPWLRHRLLDESKLLRAAQHPGLHPVGNRVLVAEGWRVGARCGHVTGPMP